MEVILSSAFGVKTESQTNPNDKVTGYAREAMNPKPYPNMAAMIPLIGRKIFDRIVVSSWGFNWGPMIAVAKSIIKGRKESAGNARIVSFPLSLLLLIIPQALPYTFHIFLYHQ